MKKSFIFTICITLSLWLMAQNIGINTTSPAEKLTVRGNLLVTLPVKKSQAMPDPAHTISLTAGNTDAALIVADSVYRIYDPGGTGNYPVNTTAAITVFDSTGTGAGGIAGGMEISFESITLAAGDSIIITALFSNSVLLRGSSNLNGTNPTFSDNGLLITFKSAAASPTAAGFSAIVRKQYVSKAEAGAGGNAGTGGASLFYNALNGSFSAGNGNSTLMGIGSFAIGMYCRATGANAAAIGYFSRATGEGAMGIAGGEASAANAVAICRYAVAEGDGSLSFGPYTMAQGSNSTAIGTDAKAYANNATAVGYFSIASGVQSNAFGANAKAQGNESVALGNSTAVGFRSTSAGTSTATGNYSTALGQNCNVNGEASFAAGYQCTTGVGGPAIALGSNASAPGANGIAIGTSVIAGGFHAVAMGYNAIASSTNTIALGNNITASGVNSIAMGSYCSTSGFTGCLTIGDNSTTTVMQTFEDNAMRARFAKGFRFYTSSAVTIGAFLNQNANSWAALSDKKLKENFRAVDGEAFLQRIAAMPLTTWNYIGQDPKEYRHYGPMAQDFFAAFGKDELGIIGNDTMINQQDFLGVNLIALQALERRTTALVAENQTLQKENADLAARLVKLEELLLKKK